MNSNEIVNKLNKYIAEKKSATKKVLLIEGEKSIQMNFDAGGRPTAWQQRKRISKRQRGTNILVISGALKNVRGLETEFGIKLTTDPRASKYARIQNEGGIINRSAGKVRIYKGRFARKGAKRYKEVPAKAGVIKIPARRVMIIPQSDYSRILNAVAKAWR